MIIKLLILKVYSLEAQSNRINNQMAILRVMKFRETIKNSMKFKNLYSENKRIFQRIFTKKQNIDEGFKITY